MLRLIIQRKKKEKIHRKPRTYELIALSEGFGLNQLTVLLTLMQTVESLLSIIFELMDALSTTRRH